MSKRDLNGVVAALAAVAAAVLAAVALPFWKVMIALAVISLLVLGWRRLEHVGIRDRIQGAAIILVIASSALILVHFLERGGHERRSAPAPRHEASPGRVLRVYDKVTSGARAMREDSGPVHLLTKAAAFCDEQKCLIPGTDRETGETYDAAVCQRRGERVTNGQDTSQVDNGNPGLFSSHRFYGVRLRDGTFGYVSEVWVAAKDRGGLRLPRC